MCICNDNEKCNIYFLEDFIHFSVLNIYMVVKLINLNLLWCQMIKEQQIQILSLQLLAVQQKVGYNLFLI